MGALANLTLVYGAAARLGNLGTQRVLDATEDKAQALRDQVLLL